MRFSSRLLGDLAGRFEHLKAPASDAPAAQQDPRVAQRVSEMLGEIERDGFDAVLRYARDLDGWDKPDVELSQEAIRASGDALTPEHRAALELGAERTRRFADLQRAGLSDAEVELAPGLTTGYRYVPVQSVGAYLPAGRFPLTAGAFISIVLPMIVFFLLQNYLVRGMTAGAVKG